MTCVLGSQMCTYRDPHRRGPSAGWVQRCLDRALQCEAALAAVVTLPGVREQLKYAADQESSRSDFAPLHNSRDPSYLSSQWQSYPLDNLEDVLSFSQRLIHDRAPTTSPYEADAPRSKDQNQSINSAAQRPSSYSQTPPTLFPQTHAKHPRMDSNSSRTHVDRPQGESFSNTADAPLDIDGSSHSQYNFESEMEPDDDEDFW